MPTPAATGSPPPSDHTVCPNCKVCFLYNDDSHEWCMRCRGRDHRCERCLQMGPRSSERLKAWLLTNKEADNVVIMTDAPADNQAVTHADLKAFGTSIASEMQNMFKDMFKSLTQPGGSGVGCSSSGADRPEARAVTNQSSRDCGRDRDVLVVHAEPDDNLDESGDSDGEDSRSVRSSWDYKRTNDPDNEDNESVISVPREEGSSLSATESEKYVNTMANLISTLDISDAVMTEKSKSRIVSSRCKDKGPQALLPFDANHISTIENVWKQDAGSISVYKKATKDRYKLVESFHDKYLKTARVQDEYLVQELERTGVKVQAKYPKLPTKEMASIETKVAQIETQSLLGISCAISQSWMLQYMTSQIEKLDRIMHNGLQADDYASITEQVSLKSLLDMSVLAQDAAMDSLDLQAREAAEAKFIRRSLWVEQTRWAPSLKTAIKHFPISGDGSLCGPQLKEKLEAYRVTSEALDASRMVSRSSSRYQGSTKRPKSTRREPSPKKMRFDRSASYSQSSRGKPRGRGRGNRTTSKPQTSSFPKPSTSNLSG